MALIVTIAVIVSVTSCTKLPKQEEQKLFPEFNVKDLQGKEVNLKDYKGKIFIINLFATWCPPCQQEIPHFVELQRKYKDKITIIGLTYDEGGDEIVLSFAKEKNINYDLYWGTKEIANYVDLRGLPNTLIIDQSGHVIYNIKGYSYKETYEKIIKSLL